MKCNTTQNTCVLSKMLMPMYMNATISKKWKAKAVITIIRTIITNLRTAAHRICTYWTNIGIKRSIISISQKRFHLGKDLWKTIINVMRKGNLSRHRNYRQIQILYIVERWLLELLINQISINFKKKKILWHKHLFVIKEKKWE